MKNKKLAIGKRSALAVACVAANAGAVWAQPTNPAQDIFDLPEGVNSITEIDPATGVWVRGVSEAERAASAQQAPRGTSGRGIFAMPEGIKSITAIDAFNILLVQTTGEVEETVQTRVNPLEKPMRQVQFDVRVIEAPANAFVSPDLNVPNGLSSFGPFESAMNITSSVRSLQEGDKLEMLLKSGLARVVNIGRVSSPSGKAAKLHWETSFPAAIRSKNANGAPLLQSTVLTDSLLVTLTPTMRDGKIMVGMQAKSELTSDGDTPLIGFPRALLSRQAANAFFNCRSGARQTLDGLWPNIAPRKDFAILPYGTVLNVDAPVAPKLDATPKPAATQNGIYIEVTATFATPQTQDATK